MFSLDWDLDNLLEGAATSPKEFHLYLDDVEEKINNFNFEIPEMFTPYQEIMDRLTEAGNVTACLTGIDTSDGDATQLEARVSSLYANFNKIGLKLDEILLKMSDEEFTSITDTLGDIRYYIEDRRKAAKDKMTTEKEILVGDLSTSGLHGLMTLYFTYMGELEFKMAEKKLNLSQLENLFGNENRDVRISSLDALENELAKRENIFGQLLNNIVDIRLQTYKARGWDDYLQETLTKNRMSRETLDSMWEAVAKNKAPLVRYLKAKAQLIGEKQPTYADSRASVGKSNETKISYEQSAKTIIDLFSSVSPIMGDFAKRAMTENWVSASVSEKKRAGGFCAEMPLSKESRILMTYSPGLRSQGTLAHELGHAFHNEALKDLPAMRRKLPINLAETASTMCEMMVHDNAIRNAKTDKEKLFLLDAKLTQYISFNMDLHSRFLFDCAFHEKRKEGFIAPHEISEMMVEAQKEGYAGAFDSYLPHFWAYKMHFYLTDEPFYNWAYTFGYLFSLGVYEHLRESGDFEQKYIALLKDTGAMNVDELAKKHLGVDLTRIDFWQGAIDRLNRDIEEFLKLAKSVHL